jgi:glycosyltransferase involved in cell wall biosynthesis
MKTLVLITSQFPFGTGESFIGTELPFLTGNFGKVIIISQNISVKMTRSIPENVTVYRYNPSTSLRGFLYLPILFILNSGIIIDMLKEEIEFRLGIPGKLTIKMFFHLFKKIIKALQLRNFISKKLLAGGIHESIVFYSYWLKTGAQAIAMLDYRDSIKISRAHGSDIYEERTDSGYLPLLKFTAINLDAIFFVSKHGKQYIEGKLKIEDPNFIVSYLGVEKPDYENTETKISNKYVIVSCSNIIPLKRIDKIIQALEIVNAGKDILWLHFGDGKMKSDIEKLAAEKLGPLTRISYSFMGNYPNNELLKYYSRNRVDLFINVSSTEGIPVSIMEAQSYGIPVIATDTGGVKELVTDTTGSLLPAGFHPEDLARLIQYYAALPEKAVNDIRMNAFINWKSNFNASSNYNDFIMKLNSIFALSNEQSLP